MIIAALSVIAIIALTALVGFIAWRSDSKKDPPP